MFKRIFSCVVCVLLLATVCCQAVSARAATTTFSLSVNDGKVGETVTVSVSLSADSYFTNCTFYVHYDSRVVSYIEDTETTGPISPSSNSMLYVMDHVDRQFVKGAYVTVKGIKKEGVLLSLDFKVLQEAAMPFSITFDECVGVDENDTEFDVTYQTVPCTLNAHAAPLASTTQAPATTNAGPVVTTNAAPAATTVANNVGGNNAAATTAANNAGNNAAATTAANNAGNIITTVAGQTVATNAQGNTVATTPTTVMTDAQGNTVATVPTTVVTDENGVTVTQAAENIPADKKEDSNTGEVIETIGASEEKASGGSLVIVIIIGICVLVAVGVTVAAVLVRKKRVAVAQTSAETASVEETPVETTTDTK